MQEQESATPDREETAAAPAGPEAVVPQRHLSKSEVRWKMKVEHVGRQAELTRALIEAKNEFPVIEKDQLVDYPMKNSDKRVTFRFASLPNILSAVTGPLSAHGLTLVGSTTGTKVIQYLEHVSGGKRRAWLKLPQNNEAMGLQEEISKRRRYMIIVLLTLAVEEHEQKDKRQRRGTSRVRGQATPAAKPQGRPDGAAKSEPEGAGETAKPVTTGTTRPAAAARPQAPAAEPAKRTAPPPAASSTTAAAKPTGTADWIYQDTPTSLALKELLPTLRPDQAAKLRQEYNNDPEQLLAEARKLHDAVYGHQGEQPQDGPGQERKGSLKDRISDAFEQLGMNTEQEQALRTEYHEDDEGLFDHLKRTYIRKRGEQTDGAATNAS